ncbi:MAG: hemolysin family protein [Defluviitaleaceae bacterium]|nr:hemolysin family protein [Defluviitaleaceae bacterium]
MNEGDPLLWSVLLQIFLITINAIFACAEIAVISMNDAKLEKLSKEGNKRAKRIMSMTSEPAKFLATVQVGTTLAGFLGSAFAANNFARRLVGWFYGLGVNLPLTVINTVSIIIITLILSYITIVLGELVPKRIAMKNAQSIGLGLSGVICVLARLFKPLVSLLTISTNGILHLLRIDPNAEDERVTEEEIRIMVDVGSEKGTIDVDEKEFIHNLFDFDDLTVEKIMTHRRDVSMLWLEEGDEEWERTIYEKRHTFHPVCGDSQDNIIGVLNTKDYFRLRDRNRDAVMYHAVKPAQLIPETARADVVLQKMKKNRNHFAIIMDDYGGMSGIITINDLLEQLVGDFDDDAEPDEKPLIEPIDSNSWHINGAAPLTEVEKIVGVSLPCEEYDTFAGMVIGLLGNIPEDGSTLEIEEYGLNIKITLIEDHRLKTAVICKI